MKKQVRNTLITALFAVSVILPAASYAQTKEITISKIPGTPEEFVQMRDALATSPEGGAAILIAALMAFSVNRDLGMACLTIALDADNLTKGNAYKGFQPAGNFNYHLGRMDGYKRWPFLAFAYVKGGTPNDGYAVKNTPPFIVVTSRNKFSGDEASGKVKVFVDVVGFRPRPISLRKNANGHWKALELSSMWLDVPAPKKAPAEEL